MNGFFPAILLTGAIVLMAPFASLLRDGLLNAFAEGVVRCSPWL